MSRATVVITTKDRRAELCRAIESVLIQTEPVDILVMDDGSTDDTTAFVRAHYPDVRVERSAECVGLVVQRNRAARLVRTPFIVSLDDDAIFTSADVVANTLAEFDHPRVAVVDIPLVHFRSGPVGPAEPVYFVPPNPSVAYLSADFHGGAHALRTDLFFSVGGYRDALFQQAEERDLAARLYDAGYVVRVGTAHAIHHFPSPRRVHAHTYKFNARNALLYAWEYVPMPQLLLHGTGTCINQIRSGLRVRRPWWSIEGLARGVADIVSRGGDRHPISRRAYGVLRWLTRDGPQPLAAVLDRLRIEEKSSGATSAPCP